MGEQLIKSLKILAFVFIVAFCSGVPVIAAGAQSTDNDDWPMFRHDLQNTGYTSADGPEEGDLIWSFDLNQELEDLLSVGTLTAAVANGTVYVCFYYNSGGKLGGRIYAFNAETGAKIWYYEINHWPGGGSPAVWNGRVFFGSEEGKVYALDAETGDELWIFNTTGEVRGAPNVANGRVFIGGGGVFYALDAETGENIWSTYLGGYIDCTPAIVDNTVYVTHGYTDKPIGNLHALNAENGEILWTFEMGTFVTSSPAVVGGKVYVGSTDGKVYALDAQSGEEIWSFEAGGSVYASPAVWNGRVFFGSWDGKVYALDAENGEEIWSFDTEGMEVNSVTIADGKIYVGSSDWPEGASGNKVYALDYASGEIIWFFHPESGFITRAPIVWNNKVYVGGGGKLFALGHSSGSGSGGTSSESLPWTLIGGTVAVVVVGAVVVFILRARKSEQTFEGW